MDLFITLSKVSIEKTIFYNKIKFLLQFSSLMWLFKVFYVPDDVDNKHLMADPKGNIVLFPRDPRHFPR